MCSICAGFLSATCYTTMFPAALKVSVEDPPGALPGREALPVLRRLCTVCPGAFLGVLSHLAPLSPLPWQAVALSGFVLWTCLQPSPSL